MVSRIALALAGLVLGVSYIIYQEPTINGSHNPMTVKVSGILSKAMYKTSRILNTLGIATDEAALRYLLRKLGSLLPVLEGIEYEDKTIAGVPVRVIRPKGSTGVLPGMVYYHGGGWVIGDLEAGSHPAYFFSQEVNMVVISVDYRLRPAHTQQDAFDDCLAVTKYFIQNAMQYSVDPNRISVSGDSAGGNIAATVSLYLRDNDFSPMPKIQLLLYPCVQMLDLHTPSYQQNAKGACLTKELTMWFFSYVLSGSDQLMAKLDKNMHIPREIREKYANGVLNHDILPKEQTYPPYKPPSYEDGDLDLWNKIKDHLLDGYMFPLFAKDHSNLPEAYIFTGQYDLIRDDGFFYAQKLREAGVKVTHYNCRFCYHTIAGQYQNNKDAEIVMSKMADFLRERL